MVGPVGISEMVVKTDGLFNFIYLMSLVSVSLGVTNLLPIPALDGGKILILIIEWVRKKPLKEEVEIKIQMMGLTILLLFSLYITYKDILKIF
jgi:regulator of sigma E protease